MSASPLPEINPGTTARSWLQQVKSEESAYFFSEYDMSDFEDLNPVETRDMRGASCRINHDPDDLLPIIVKKIWVVDSQDQKEQEAFIKEVC